MENRKSLKLVFLNLTLAILISPVFCYSYSDETTHPALTNESVDIFNYKYPDLILSENERNLIVQGSIDEDSPTYRPLNHFFDPVYNVGLLKVSMSAKSWSQNTRFQAGFSNLAGIGLVKGLFQSNSDYSWDRAIYDYVYGDKERALKALGHNLHLIQDMAVPPHVRNDQHLSGVDDSPYEIFTKQFDKIKLVNLSDEVKNKDIVVKNSLDEYFDSMAVFTNSNFFSKDTVYYKKYNFLVNLVGEERVDLSNGDFVWFEKRDLNKRVDYLVGFKKVFDAKKNIFVKEYFLKDYDNLILTDYWNILSKQAVLHSAGVIKLFFEEVEREKQTLVLYNKNKSFLAKVGEKIATIFSGENKSGIDSAGNGLASVVDSINNSGSSGSLDEGEGSEANIGFNENVDNSVYNLLESGGLAVENFDLTNQNQNEEGQNNGSEAEENDNFVNESAVNLSQGETYQYQNNNSQNYYPGGGFGGGGPNPSQTTSDETSSVSDQTSNSENQIATPVVVIPNPPIIISPNLIQQANSTVLVIDETQTVTTIIFSGTASSTEIISTDFSSETTIVGQNNDWRLSLENLPQGTTTVSFFASNQEQTATSTATTIEFFVDSKVPDVSLVVEECQNSISESSCLFANTSVLLNINWFSLSEDFDHFILNKNGDINTTFSTSTQISISGNQTYLVGVSAVDKNGNVSTEVTQTIQINNAPVIINEVAWAGTQASSDDEWIELYNNTDKEINLNNWVIYTEDLGVYVPLSGVIYPKGFYLLERTDDSTINNITADKIYTGGLNNKGEHLILALSQNNSTTTIDHINKANKWMNKGHANPYYSMERYNPKLSGEDWSNWFSNNGTLVKNGIDSDGNLISGTPKAKNSISYLISATGLVDSDKFLDEENSPYIINYDLKISEGATLSVDSGVVIKIQPNKNISLVVKGVLETKGTEEKPVVFTSLSDDEFGGDTNGDGICEPTNTSSTSACPNLGDWDQILVESSSQNSSLKNTIFRYGGYYTNGQVFKYKGMVTVDNTNIIIENSVFEFSKSKGLQLINSGSNTLVFNSIFRNNNYEHPILADYSYGLWVEGGSPVVKNNLFENNVYGAFFGNSKSVVDSNIFKNNSKKSVYGFASNIFSDNSGEGNGLNGIFIGDSFVNSGFSRTLSKNFLPYVIDSNVAVVASSTLSIDSGVVIKFRDKKFEVEGNLFVDGGVLFTSIDDDSDGVNVENNDQPDTILTGNYRGLYMKPGSVSEIKNAEFSYMKCAVNYENSPIYLENVTFRNNAMAVCFDTDSATSTVNNLIFENNTATSSSPLF